MVKEIGSKIDLSQLHGVTSTAMPKKLFEMIAPIMGWSWPKGETIFYPTDGKGKDTKPKKTKRSFGQGFITNQLVDIGEKRSGMIPIVKEFVTPIPSFTGSVNFMLNGESFWMSYGATVKFKKNDEGELVPEPGQDFPMIHARKKGDMMSNPGCIVVQAHEKELFAYLMLHPCCSISPFQMSVEEMDKSGIRMSQAGTDMVRTPHMTPNNVIRTAEERDFQAVEDIELLSALRNKGEAELLQLVEKVRISVNTNVSNPSTAIIARFKDLIDGKNSSHAHKEKYTRLKEEVLGGGDSKITREILEEALKYGVLTKDSSVWYHNGKMVPFSVMDDITSGSVATPGDEIGWFANKINLGGYNDWINMISMEADLAMDEKKSQTLGRSGPGTKHHVLSEAIAQEIILGYDKNRKIEGEKSSDRNYRWKDTGQAICQAKQYGSTRDEKTLKVFLDDLTSHFRDYDLESLIDLIEQHR